MSEAMNFTPATQPGSAPKIPQDLCISIVGMAAAGKTRIGAEIARILGWAHVDADHLIESIYGARLQEITDVMSKDEFLDLEAHVICKIRLKRAVISTGGSVVYREAAVEHLKTLGPILHLDVPLDIILERIARKPDRGLAIAPGQTIEDLFNERHLLYRKAAQLTVKGGEDSPQTYAAEAVKLLEDYIKNSR